MKIKELIGTNEQDQEYTLEQAQIILQQIQYPHLNVVMSWGADNFQALELNGFTCLMFEVNGFLYKGIILVRINILDEYEIYKVLKIFKDKDENLLVFKCEQVKTGVYFDGLQTALDRIIENAGNMEQYKSYVTEEYINTEFEELLPKEEIDKYKNNN